MFNYKKPRPFVFIINENEHRSEPERPAKTNFWKQHILSIFSVVAAIHFVAIIYVIISLIRMRESTDRTNELITKQLEVQRLIYDQSEKNYKKNIILFTQQDSLYRSMFLQLERKFEKQETAHEGLKRKYQLLYHQLSEQKKLTVTQ